MIRVCHVMSADLWAGAEVQVATVAAYLAARPDVRLSAVLLNEGRLAAELRQLGVPVSVVDEREHGPIGTVVRLRRLLERSGAEIVHTHRYKDTVLGSIAARLAGVRHVVRTVHGLNEAMGGWTRSKLAAYDVLDRTALRLSGDGVVAVSRRIADSLGALGYGFPPVTHIPNGIDLGRLSVTRGREAVRQEMGIGGDDFLVGTAGRLSPVKGHVHLLRAARSILRQQRRARFVIAGDGPLRDELAAEARRLGIERECLLVGPRADVLDLVAALDVFVLPSLDEGVPMALLEAMALGRPVVAAAVGGVPEVVTDRASGRLVPPADADALAEACLELARDEFLARRLGAQARRVVEDRFSHERSGEALMGLYRRVVTAERSGLLQRARRKLDHALARRRMILMRRNATRARRALGSTRSVLIVCHGNVIRSPFAAGLMARAVADRQPTVTVASAGLEARPGRPAHPTAVDAAAERGIDLRHHAAAPVTAEAVRKADVILVMEVPHAIALGRRHPAARAKTFLITCLAPEAPMEIADPYDGDAPRFRACFDAIAEAVPALVCSLGEAAGPGRAAAAPLAVTGGEA